MWPALLTAGLGLRICAGFFSDGFHHYDEHFQVLEFLRYRQSPDAEGAAFLPWEFHERMRPWIQIFFFDGLSRIASALGITSRWHWATIFRFSSVVLAIAAAWQLLAAWATRASPTNPDEKEGYRWMLAVTALHFGLPYLGARISSETVAGSLFALAFGIYLNRPRDHGPSWSRALITGLFVGLAVAVRFQVGMMAAGFGLWMLAVDRLRVSCWLGLVATAIAVQFASAALDYWGYGEWTFAVGNNLKQNLIEGKSEQFGTRPFWAYLRMVAEHVPPLGLATLGAWGWALWKHPRDPAVWATVPMFVAHSLIPHKELRFLFSLAPFIPWMAGLAAPAFLSSMRKSRIWRGAAVVALGMNVVALFFFTFVPRRTEVTFMRKLEARFPSGFEYAIYGVDPYVLAGVRVKYYPKAATRSWLVIDPSEADPVARLREALTPALRQEAALWVIRAGNGFLDADNPLRKKCRREFASLPDFLEKAPSWARINKLHVRELYACDPGRI